MKDKERNEEIHDTSGNAIDDITFFARNTKQDSEEIVDNSDENQLIKDYVDINSDFEENTQDKEIDELHDIINDFQNVSNKCMEGTDRSKTSSITQASGDAQGTPVKSKKKKNTRKPSILNNLIMICMMIVLLMQIHMYILLYNKFNTVHQEIKEISCNVFGKNCPDLYSAHACIINRLDYMDAVQERSMETIRRDLEEIDTVLSNITSLYYSYHENPATDIGRSEDQGIFKKPLRTGPIYVNP